MKHSVANSFNTFGAALRFFRLLLLSFSLLSFDESWMRMFWRKPNHLTSKQFEEISKTEEIILQRRKCCLLKWEIERKRIYRETGSLAVRLTLRYFRCELCACTMYNVMLKQSNNIWHGIPMTICTKPIVFCVSFHPCYSLHFLVLLAAQMHIDNTYKRFPLHPKFRLCVVGRVLFSLFHRRPLHLMRIRFVAALRMAFTCECNRYGILHEKLYILTSYTIFKCVREWARETNCLARSRRIV